MMLRKSSLGLKQRARDVKKSPLKLKQMGRDVKEKPPIGAEAKEP
jgi:hypothetical protein